MKKKAANESLSGRTLFKSLFASLFGSLSKLGLGSAGAVMASSVLGSVAVAGMLTALPLAAVGVVATSVLAARHKARPELSGLTMIVVYIARIRLGVVAADHEDFVCRLRACL